MVDTAQLVVRRDYQQECLDRNVEAYQAGVRRALNALPTGTGKTNIGVWSYEALNLGPMLWVAHREELIAQAEERVRELLPGVMVEVEQASKYASTNADIVIACISTIRNPQRLERLDPDRFRSLVFDEAHHSLAPMWLNLMHRFNLAPPPPGRGWQERFFTDRNYRQYAGAYLGQFEVDPSAPYLMGFTATPHRTDRMGLEFVFDTMVFSRTMPEMIDAGWLCHIRAWRIATDVSLANVGQNSKGDDFRESQLAVVNTPGRNRQAVQAYLEYARGKQAICFCVDKKHTFDMEQAFKDAGIVAASVVDNTPNGQRRRIVEDYRKGYIQVLCNCMVFSEGFDAPETGCIIMCRPTQSQLLYTQFMGRGTRPHSRKEYLIVIDLVDISSTGVCTVNTIFGLDQRLPLMGTDPIELARHLEQAAREITTHVERDPRQSKIITETGEFDALAPISPPEHYGATMSWVRADYGWTMGLAESTENISLCTDLLGHCQIKVQIAGRVHWLEKYPDEIEALHHAEEWVRDMLPDRLHLLELDAPWRLELHSERQADTAFCAGLDIQPWMTKGEVKQLCDAHFANTPATDPPNELQIERAEFYALTLRPNATSKSVFFLLKNERQRRRNMGLPL